MPMGITYKDTTVYADMLYGSGARASPTPTNCPDTIRSISDLLIYFIFLKSTARFSFVLMSQMSSTKAISFGAGQGLASSLRNSVHEEAFSAA